MEFQKAEVILLLFAFHCLLHSSRASAWMPFFFIIIMLVVLWKLKWILRMEQYIPSYFIILLWAFHFMICLTSNNKYLVVYGRENLNLTWCLVAFREKMSLQPLNLMLSLSQVNVCMFVLYSTCNNLRLRVFLWIGFASGLCNNLN